MNNIDNKTIWEEVKIKKYPSLKQDSYTDILIIGGGIVGILCGYELDKRNIKYMIVEKDRIGSGTTLDTTAFITAQHETLYQDLIKEKGIKTAQEYLSLNLEALERYKQLAREYNFDYEECDSIIYSSSNENIILREKEALKTLNYDAEIVTSLEINDEMSLGIKFKNQAKINPRKFVKEISKHLLIYENTKIIKLKGKYAYTDKYKIHFKKVIVATHYPLINKTNLLFTKLTQRRSYVACIEYPQIKNTYCNIDQDGLYFRSYGKYLLIGGNDRDNKEKCVKSFFNKINKYINGRDIKYYWSGQDTISLDGIPYIGKCNILNNDYYIATGFNLWGFTWAMASSFIIADLIENKKKYHIVDPNRFFINKNLFKNISNSLKNLLTFKKPRCTHLGCALNYNEKEEAWECPCHGSRYDKNGMVLNGPATKDKDMS